MSEKKKSGEMKPQTGKPQVSGKKWIPVVAVAATVILLAIVVVVIVKTFGSSEKDQPQTAEPLPEESYDPQQCVELGEYTGIKVSLKVTQEDLQAAIESELEEHAIYEQLDGTVEDGDLVYGDFAGYVDGQEIDATSGSDYIEIGSGEWIFENGLPGVTTGQTAVFTVPVPAGYYGDDRVDGKDVEFRVTVQYICGDQILPEYNDDFVKSISKKYKTTEEYNEHLQKREEQENEEQKAEFVWAEVMEVCKVKTYPKSLLETSKQEVLQGYYDMAAVYECSQEEVFPLFGYESEQDFVDTELEELGKDTAKEYLIAQAIAAVEGIAYTEEEYEAFKAEEFSYQEGQYSTVEDFEKEKTVYLENQLLLEKVKNWLMEKAVFTR